MVDAPLASRSAPTTMVEPYTVTLRPSWSPGSAFDALRYDAGTQAPLSRLNTHAEPEPGAPVPDGSPLTPAAALASPVAPTTTRSTEATASCETTTLEP